MSQHIPYMYSLLYKMCKLQGKFTNLDGETAIINIGPLFSWLSTNFAISPETEKQQHTMLVPTEHITIFLRTYIITVCDNYHLST